jgi:integrase
MEGQKMETKAESKPRRARGEGSIYLRGKIYWVKYYSRGRAVCESSGSERELDARRLLRRRLGEVAAGQHPQLRRITYEDLRRAYVADYVMNHRRSLRFDKAGNPRLTNVTRLDKFFAGYQAAEIDAELMREFAMKLQTEDDLSDGTVNHSLSALRRMFHIALKDGKLRTLPHFPMLKASTPRQGFFERETYDRLRAALPDYVQVPLAVGYFTGMRRAEILGLRWEQVDFMEKKIRLRAGETKNGEGREIPVTGELAAVLKQQHAKRHAGCDLVCFRVDRKGKAVRVGDMRKVWYDRCVKLEFGRFIQATDAKTGEPLFEKPRGPRSKPKAKMIYEGLIFHDLRRSAVRNLVRAGVPQKQAMDITGHKTTSVFQRYDITSGKDIQEAGRKLDQFHSPANGDNSGTISVPEPSGKQLVQ